jgi:isoquinoline 1-oxidoreductase alpha subunit
MKLRVNNEELEVRVAPDTPLLWVLREQLSLTGAKFGCGKGLCGACTVHANGQPIRSCVIPVSAVADMSITTIEGLGAGDHPVQRAWQELDVPQCGYCQSGQIMSAVALLAENPAPDDAAIDAAMEGNLCRCGTYVRIRAAIKLAARNGSGEGGAA